MTESRSLRVMSFCTAVFLAIISNVPEPNFEPDQQSQKVDRRDFLRQTAGTMLASSAMAMPARSYARVPGANDRIRIAQLGCGDRSHGHVRMAHMALQRTPVEVVAVCDIWSVARERRAAQ